LNKEEEKMKKWMQSILVTGLLSAGAVAENGPVRFRVELKPIGGITSSDLDGLGIQYTTGSFSYSETIDGSASYMGTLQVGLEINAKPCYIDFLAGGGFTGNEAFGSGLFTGDIGVRFKLNEAGTIAFGPFFGVIVPTDAEWEVREDGDEGTMDMNGNTGWQGGVKLTGGWEQFSLVLQLGYADYGYDFDANNPGDWRIRRDDGPWQSYASANKEVDMAGFFGQFGVTAQF
jgi:hypothetical protein